MVFKIKTKKTQVFLKLSFKILWQSYSPAMEILGVGNSASLKTSACLVGVGGRVAAVALRIEQGAGSSRAAMGAGRNTKNFPSPSVAGCTLSPLSIRITPSLILLRPVLSDFPSLPLPPPPPLVGKKYCEGCWVLAINALVISEWNHTVRKKQRSSVQITVVFLHGWTSFDNFKLQL